MRLYVQIGFMRALKRLFFSFVLDFLNYLGALREKTVDLSAMFASQQYRNIFGMKTIWWIYKES